MGTWVSERDHARALDVLGACADVRSTRELLAIMLPALQPLLRSDEVSSSVVSPSLGRVVSAYGYPTTTLDLPAAAGLWLSRPLEHPWMTHYLRTRDLATVLVSDVYPGSRLLQLRYYADFYKPKRVRYAAYATIATEGSTVVGVGAGRLRQDYSDRERSLFEHLRRPLGAMWHLASAREQLVAINARRSVRPDVDSIPRPAAARVPALTPAEEQVVTLLLEGWGNAAIALAMFVSTKAVENHLTHIYRKHGVTSRTQLVLKLTEDRRSRHQAAGDSPIAAE